MTREALRLAIFDNAECLTYGQVRQALGMPPTSLGRKVSNTKLWEMSPNRKKGKAQRAARKVRRKGERR